MTGGTAVSYEWAVSADGEEWSVVDTEDDATFGVTPDLLGMYVKVTVIDDEANVASDVTTEPVAENEDFGEIEITSAEAIAANKIAVTLANPVISTDTTITVAKGSNTVDVTAKWADTFDSVSLTTPTNMSEGTYTVTLTSTEDPTNTDSATFEVEGQKIAQIKILNETALTNKETDSGRGEHEIAYAYYDVLDQYGESIRTSASIQWSGSAELVSANKTTGLLKLAKSTRQAWVYGEKIYLTGVYTKTGVAQTAELTIGTEQALDSIEVAGFVKKNTTDLKSTLPADFKSGEWYLLFNAYDQNKNLIQAGGITDDDISILSDTVLVVKEVKGVEPNTITIDDVEYNAIGVEPGIKVADGGKVKFTAIATRTGNKTEYDCVVGIDQVIVSFTMSAPTATVADGEAVEIPFVALDEDGNEVTDFVTIAKQETFNALSLNVGGNGRLRLQESDTGEAVLYYDDAPVGLTWADSETTDGIDRPVSLTAVVLGGETDNQMISISDMARPDAIKAVPGLNDVYVEGDTVALALADEEISFYDQYGRDMDALAAAGIIDSFDNGFFGAEEYKGGNDFKGYTFSVQATYTGNGGLYVPADPAAARYVPGIDTLLATTPKSGWVLSNGGNIATNLGYGVVAGDAISAAKTTEDVENSRTNEGFKFEIVKVKTTKAADITEYEVVSRSKTATFTVVDISKVKNFTISDLGTLYVGSDATYTGDGTVEPGDDDANIIALSGSALIPFTAEEGDTKPGLVNDSDYQKTVEVTGTYNGSTVEIPAKYYTSTGKKVTPSDPDATPNTLDEIIDSGTEGGLSIQDLYDKTSARGTSKLAEDTITSTIVGLYASGTAATLEDDIPSTITDADTVLPYDDDSLTASADFTVDAVKTTISLDGLTYAEALDAIDDELATLATLGTLNEAGTAFTAANEAYGDLLLQGDLEAEAWATAKATLVGNVKTALNDAWTDLTETRAALMADLTTIGDETVATATTKVYLSDQAPTPTAFSGLASSYTITPTNTDFDNDDIKDMLKKVKVVDQYGVTLVSAGTEAGQTAAEVLKKVSNIEENTARYVEDNFTVNNNNKTTLSLEGIELGDTFDLTLTYESLEETVPVTVGADANAYIDEDGNMYLDTLGLQPELERQRKAILGIA